MDLLTDLLQQAGLRRRLLDLRHLAPRSALQFPCDKSIGLHVVTHGQVCVHTDRLKTPITLQAGDIAVMARGCHHVLSPQASLRGTRPVAVSEVWRDEPEAGQDRTEGEGEGSSMVISGAYQLWNAPVHPFFNEMPDWFVLRADSHPRLGPLALAVGLLDAEVKQRQLGAETIVHGLLDVVMTYLLREMVSQQGQADGAGWSHAMRDLQVRQAVALMHKDCARAWTLEELADGAGLSRTSLAERFRQAMGDTPLSYLRTVRMQKAVRILSETEKTLEQVAQEVGYQDAFSFSKVFKRTVGVAPREFRRQDAQDKSLPWRIKSQ